MSLIDNIMAYITDSGSFARMKAFNTKAIQLFEDYNDFIWWNTRCLNEMTFEDQVWVWGFCKRLKEFNVTVVDLEDCDRVVYSLFYDKNKKMCVVHIR